MIFEEEKKVFYIDEYKNMQQLKTHQTDLTKNALGEFFKTVLKIPWLTSGTK